MRDIYMGALTGVRDVLRGVIEEAAQGNQLTPDEQVARYISQHRGNPLATARFVSENAPAGTNPLAAWRKYEADMERQLTERGIVRRAHAAQAAQTAQPAQPKGR